MIQHRFLAATATAVFLFLGGVVSSAAQTADDPMPSPEEFFGHPMGADRELISYDDFLPYYELLAGRSDRVEIQRIGTTTTGREIVMLLISTPENLARSGRYREIAARLNDPRGLNDEELNALVEEGKVILLITLNIHSSEICSSQMGMEWVWQLATGDWDSPAQYLEDVIVLLVPSVNPDGQVMITDWYKEHVDSRFDGGNMPWLYHQYAGHDNNRDWFMLNLSETRAVNRVAYHEWFPQMLVDEHQMGNTGPRAFVPPYTDPVSDKVHPLIHRSALLVGANMAMDLEQANKSGVIYGYSFDSYWPGGTRSTPWWKNTVGILIELASARIASPIYVDPGELSGGRKGLPDYQAQVNFPNPWPGGWWRPRDIVEYELIISDSALRTCSLHREDFLRNRPTMARDAIRRGESEAPYGYVIPPDQHDPGTASKLVDLLIENGVEVFHAPAQIVAGGQIIPAGSYVTLAAQPFRSFLVEMMEPQVYPEVRVGPGSDEIYRPYDVTAWTLPYLLGVNTFELKSPGVPALERIENPEMTGPTIVEGTGTHWALSPAENDAYTAVLRLLERGDEVLQVRSSFTAGRTRWPAGTFLTEAPREHLEEALTGLRVTVHSVSKPTQLAASTPTMIQAEGLTTYPYRVLHTPRIGIYQSYLASMDEGWTRYVLDDFEFPKTALHNKDIQNGNLSRYDVIILPDMNRTQLVEGKWSTQPGRFEEPRPKPYGGGLDKNGVEALEGFVRLGGTLITFGNASELAIEDLNIPVRNLTGHLPRKDFSTPGTLLRVTLDTEHPLGYGMPDEAVVYHTTNPVLGTRLPSPGSQRAVVARFMDNDEVLASGWAEGIRHLERKAALVEVSLGKGKVVLFAFRPQHRAQTHGTYRLIFNAMFNSSAN
jgi:hypothetical protein